MMGWASARRTRGGQPNDLRYEAQVRVNVTNGSVSGSGDTITVQDADELLVPDSEFRSRPLYNVQGAVLKNGMAGP